jgi:hypothetical protein
MQATYSIVVLNTRRASAAPQDGLTSAADVENDWYCYIFKVRGIILTPAPQLRCARLRCFPRLHTPPGKPQVQPCPKRGSHDWSSCPYAHPKEKARRRDPRIYKYVSSPCPESLKVHPTRSSRIRSHSPPQYIYLKRHLPMA